MEDGEQEKPKPRKKTYRSFVWKYFLKQDNGGECKLCGRYIKSSGNTTNLSNHIKKLHGNVLRQAVYDEAEEATSFYSNEYGECSHHNESMNTVQNGDVDGTGEVTEKTTVQQYIKSFGSEGGNSAVTSALEGVQVHTVYPNEPEYMDNTEVVTSKSVRRTKRQYDHTVSVEALYDDSVDNTDIDFTISDDDMDDDDYAAPKKRGAKNTRSSKKLKSSNANSSFVQSIDKLDMAKKQMALLAKQKRQLVSLEKDLMLKRFTAEMQLIELQKSLLKSQRENEVLKTRVLTANLRTTNLRAEKKKKAQANSM